MARTPFRCSQEEGFFENWNATSYGYSFQPLWISWGSSGWLWCKKSSAGSSVEILSPDFFQMRGAFESRNVLLKSLRTRSMTQTILMASMWSMIGPWKVYVLILIFLRSAGKTKNCPTHSEHFTCLNTYVFRPALPWGPGWDFSGGTKPPGLSETVPIYV